MIKLRGDKFRLIILLIVTIGAIATLAYTVITYEIFSEFINENKSQDESFDLDSVAPTSYADMLNLEEIKQSLSILKDSRFVNLRVIVTNEQKNQLRDELNKIIDENNTFNTSTENGLDSDMREEDLRRGNPFIPFN